MACTLSNKCAKNLSKRTVLLQLIIKNVVTCFFGTQCIHATVSVMDHGSYVQIMAQSLDRPNPDSDTGSRVDKSTRTISRFCCAMHALGAAHTVVRCLSRLCIASKRLKIWPYLLCDANRKPYTQAFEWYHFKFNHLLFSEIFSDMKHRAASLR